MSEPLFPALHDPGDREAIRIAGRALSYPDLSRAAASLAARMTGANRVAVWAEPTLELCVAVLGALAAGVPIVPINPGLGPRELGHIVEDSAPEKLIAWAGVEPPEQLARLDRVDVDVDATTSEDRKPVPGVVRDDDAAFIMYTSGTTGPPKGVQIPRRALASNLDALAEIWQWTADDRVAQALPVFHVHGLILGLLGPLRRGGSVEHVGRFSPGALAEALTRGATMVFGVPTMYTRIARAAEEDRQLAEAFGKARLLISGSAALPTTVHEAMKRLTGQEVLERYGLTETLMNTGARLGDPIFPGRVGPPLPGVELRLVGEDGETVEATDDETIGEVAVRGSNLFLGYLNRDDATEEAMRNGWFMTGDMATRNEAGSIKLVGRKSTDMIKSGGYRIGAGEIEGALLEHPAVAEAAVTAKPDEDLGERIVAWVVLEDDCSADPDELSNHVATLLTKHKRPREVHFVDELPRNAMGKVMKRELGK